MNTHTIEKLIKNIHHMLELDEQKRELLFKLIEAIMVKDYRDKNPNAKSVIFASYYMSNIETRVVEKYPTYECIDSKDQKRIDRLQRKYQSQYRKLKIKSYDLTKFIPDKTIATCQEQITKSLN